MFYKKTSEFKLINIFQAPSFGIGTKSYSEIPEYQASENQLFKNDVITPKLGLHWDKTDVQLISYRWQLDIMGFSLVRESQKLIKQLKLTFKNHIESDPDFHY